VLHEGAGEVKRSTGGKGSGAPPSESPQREPTLPGETLRRLLALSERGLSRLLTEIPGVQREGGGRSPQVPLAGLLVALHRRSSRRGSYSPDGEPPDPLLVGGSSPALERYRCARAEAAERENLVAQGELVERNRVERSFEEIGRLLRVEIEAIYLARPETKGAFEIVLQRAQDAFVEWSKLNPLSDFNGNGHAKEGEGHEVEAAQDRIGGAVPAKAVG